MQDYRERRRQKVTHQRSAQDGSLGEPESPPLRDVPAVAAEPVPKEDLHATACAVYAVLLGAHARGLASYWRTPAVLRTPQGHGAVGLSENERFVSLIHLGPAESSPPEKERAAGERYVTFLD